MNSADIKRVRKILGMSQIEFSNAIGISQPYLSDIENERRNISKEIESQIVNYAKDKNIIIQQHDIHSVVEEIYIPYNSQKKGKEEDIRQLLRAEKVIRVNEYIQHERYTPGTYIGLIKNTGTLLYGRMYVIELKGDVYPVICHVYPEPTDKEQIIIKIGADAPGQHIHRSDIQQVYTIAGTVDMYF